jgi:hypothetical protein
MLRQLRGSITVRYAHKIVLNHLVGTVEMTWMMVRVFDTCDEEGFALFRAEKLSTTTANTKRASLDRTSSSSIILGFVKNKTESEDNVNITMRDNIISTNKTNAHNLGAPVCMLCLTFTTFRHKQQSTSSALMPPHAVRTTKALS